MKMKLKSLAIILGALFLVTACSSKDANDGANNKELTGKVKELEDKEEELLKELKSLHEAVGIDMGRLNELVDQGCLSEENKKEILEAAYAFEYTGSEKASFRSEWELIKTLKKDNLMISAISSATCTMRAVAHKALTLIQAMIKLGERRSPQQPVDQEKNLAAYLKKAIELYSNRIEMIAAFCEQ